MLFGYLFAAWALLDLITYARIKQNMGFSLSFGLFLNIWILFQIVILTIKITSFYTYAGLVFLILSLFAHKLLKDFL